MATRRGILKSYIRKYTKKLRSEEIPLSYLEDLVKQMKSSKLK